MATIVSDLIRDSFVLAQIVADDEPLSGGQGNEGLVLLNNILDEWSAIPNFIPTYSLVSLSTVAGTFQYNITPTITQLLEANIFDVNNNQWPLTQIFLKEQNLINYQISGQTQPNSIFVQNDQSTVATGISKIFLYPVPDNIYTVTLYVKQIMANLAYSDTVITLPARVIKCLHYQLSKDLSSKYSTILPQSFWDEYEKVESRLKAANKKDMSVQNSNPMRSIRRFRPWGGMTVG